MNNILTIIYAFIAGRTLVYVRHCLTGKVKLVSVKKYTPSFYQEIEYKSNMYTGWGNKGNGIELLKGGKTSDPVLTEWHKA